MANYQKSLLLVNEHLEKGEKIQASVYGAYETKIIGQDSVRNGVLVGTDRRVVFFSKKLFGYDFETFPFNKISSIEMSKGLMGHSITFFASGNKVKMKWINNDNVTEFTQYISSRIGQHSEALSEKIASIDDIPNQILSLSDLKDRGILTEAEFTAKKTELLSKM